MKIILNDTVANLTLNEEKFKLAAGKHVAVTDEVADSEYIQEAKKRGWLKVLNSEKELDKAEIAKAPEVTFTVDPAQGSSTYPGSTVNEAQGTGTVTDAKPTSEAKPTPEAKPAKKAAKEV
jgi:hypothetical protein